MVLQGKKIYNNALLAGGLSFITFGWDAGVLGGILLTPEFQTAMGMPNTTTISMITSVFLLASWLGCIIVSLSGLFLGRRTWIILGSSVQIVGTIISASSYSYGQLIAGRVLIGIGNGFCTSMVPIFVAEMAIITSKRGQGVNAILACASLGTAFAYWVDFGMVFAHNTQAVWRFPVAFQIVWALLTIGFLLRSPDTPRYLYARDRDADGDAVLERLYEKSISDSEVALAKQDILASLELERTTTAGLRIKDFFYDTSDIQAARRIRTGMILIGVAYLMGIDMIFYYTTTIFQVYIGLAPLTASGLAGAATSVLAITNFVGVVYMEKFKRRTWLIFGAIGQTVFLAAFTGLLSSPGHATGAAAAAMLFCWIAIFGPTWCPVTYVYASEIMPLRYRHVGFALSVSSQWLMAFVTVYAGPIAIADPNVGWKTWIWFLVFNAIAAPYVYFCCPETRGLTLEGIDLIFMSARLHETPAAKQLEHDFVAESTATDTDSGKEGNVAVVPEKEV
ncbi:sugar transporter-like protein [Mytilinidion resinicola]|uniref:Sugar transporter-like protein n=1 Tax=Mytilinidion resinicola TaxID=574789 RepID=A0A6A6Z7S9_9PEZI|nr:sugar transporter-like protein [Mytilinidion resinicola]KAF2816325.1 sugar transporter-like protein [Mytilinidion resinicola]